jgi:hypothetical protein
MDLASFDVFIALPSQPVIEISSSSHDSHGNLSFTPEFSEFRVQLQFDDLMFADFSVSPMSLALSLVEPANSFNGGLVVRALVRDANTPFALNDSTPALVVDPALVPEPSSMALFGVGASVFAALRRASLRLARPRAVA